MAHSPLSGHHTVLPPAFMLRGCLPSSYCILNGSLTPSFRALGFSNVAFYFKLPSWFLPHFHLTGTHYFPLPGWLFHFRCLRRLQSKVHKVISISSWAYSNRFAFTALYIWGCVYEGLGAMLFAAARPGQLERVQWGGSRLCRSLRLEGLVEAQNRRILVEKAAPNNYVMEDIILDFLSAQELLLC